MVPSFMLSALRARFPAHGYPDFEAAFPGEWIVWEATRWVPPALNATQTAVIQLPQNAGTGGSGTALAMWLKLPVGRTELTLGREAPSDIEINDGTLSRTHLTLAKTQLGWTVADAESRNGSLLEGRPLLPRVPSAPLKDGSRLEAGQVNLTFHDSRGLFMRVQLSR